MNHMSHLKLILGAVAVLAVLGALGVPVMSYLPFVVLLAVCPLMMIIMMRSMDHGGGPETVDTDDGSRSHLH